MDLIGRPRVHYPDRPATSTERGRVFALKRRSRLAELEAKLAARVEHRATRTDVETPWPIFAEYDAEFHFTLDVCALATNTKCPRFFSPDDNGLLQDWGTDICWCNPPYGRGIEQWVEKAYRSSLLGATVLCFIPARTSNVWWHAWVRGKAEVRERRGRVQFVGETKNAPFPSVAAIYRPQSTTNS